MLLYRIDQGFILLGCPHTFRFRVIRHKTHPAFSTVFIGASQDSCSNILPVCWWRSVRMFCMSEKCIGQQKGSPVGCIVLPLRTDSLSSLSSSADHVFLMSQREGIMVWA